MALQRPLVRPPLRGIAQVLAALSISEPNV